MSNFAGHAGGEDEISFDPDDIIENIEQVCSVHTCNCVVEHVSDASGGGVCSGCSSTLLRPRNVYN